MTPKTETRTCANCAYFVTDPIPELGETSCANGIRFTARVGTPLEFIRDPLASDKDCSEHLTYGESAQEDEFIEDCVAVGGLQVAELALEATAAARAAIRAARLGA
jgi:hypothetical protein